MLDYYAIFLFPWINIFFQIEKSPTLGSIETSDYEKKQLAFQSLEYNIRNKVFCELFPETVNEIKVILFKKNILKK